MRTTKTNTKTFEEEERELIFCKDKRSHFDEVGAKKEKKTGKSKKESSSNHNKNARVYVTTGGEKSDDDE